MGGCLQRRVTAWAAASQGLLSLLAATTSLYYWPLLLAPTTSLYHQPLLLASTTIASTTMASTTSPYSTTSLYD